MRKIVTKKSIYLLGLLIISLLGLILTPTYAHFGQAFTTTEDVVGMNLTFDLNISNIEEYEEINVPTGGYQIFNVEVKNGISDTIYYGIWYKMVTPEKRNNEIIISKLEGTSSNTSGKLTSTQSTTITIIVKNNSNEYLKLNIGVGSSTTSTSDIEYLEGKYLITGESNANLTGFKVGSYVKYIGNNGCSGTSCSGQNANYVNDSNMGYCGDSTYKYSYNGWRIGYVDDSSAYLISAGAPECMCTNSDGTTSSSSTCSSYEAQSAEPVYHFDNLNNKALTYCNKAFVSDNICNNSTTWSINKTDFNILTNSQIDSCLNLGENMACGYQNSLVDVGSKYWFTNPIYTSSQYYILEWYPYWETIGYSYVGASTTQMLHGIRSIIKLDSSVKVIGGTGTYRDPYLIDNPNTIKDLSGNMNHGVNDGGTWEQDTGTLKLDSDSYNSVSAGLVNYNFGDKVSFVLRVKFHKTISGKENTLIGNFEGAGGGIMLSPSGNLFFGFCTESTRQYSYFVTSMVPELETWYTIVGVYDGANLLLYLNGQPLEWNSSSTEYPSYNSNTASGNVLISSVPIMLGANPNVGGTSQWGTYADVTYSDVLIFDRALSASEIATDYSGKINPTNTQNLLLYYDFIR